MRVASCSTFHLPSLAKENTLNPRPSLAKTAASSSVNARIRLGEGERVGGGQETNDAGAQNTASAHARLPRKPPTAQWAGL